MPESIITIADLTKEYGKLKAVNQLSLEINKGEIFGLLGPNGAGKTTTILMLLGLTEPTAGQVTVCGVDATRNPIEVKKKVGYMPDSVGFYNQLTALENLMFIGRLNGIQEAELKDRAQQTMELVGLKGRMNQKTATYSRGMKQRLGLADVLMRDPEVVILDEPTLGIDPKGIQDFLKLIHRLSRDNGLTVLLSSHHLHQVQQICDRVGIFVEGRLLVEGEIETLSGELFDQESFEITVESTETVNPGGFLEELRSLKPIQNVDITENKVNVSAAQEVTPQIIEILVRHGIPIKNLQKREFGLDEIYHRYFEESGGNTSFLANESGVFNSWFKRTHKEYKK